MVRGEDWGLRICLWYACFYPIHVIAGAALFTSLLMMFVASLLTAIDPRTAIGLLAVPAFGPSRTSK